MSAFIVRKGSLLRWKTDLSNWVINCAPFDGPVDGRVVSKECRFSFPDWVGRTCWMDWTELML